MCTLGMPLPLGQDPAVKQQKPDKARLETTHGRKACCGFPRVEASHSFHGILIVDTLAQPLAGGKPHRPAPPSAVDIPAVVE